MSETGEIRTGRTVVGTGELMKHLDIDSREGLGKVAGRLGFEKLGRGKWDLDDCRLRYIRHLRETAAGRAASGGLDLAQERARLARAQTEKTDLDVQVRRHELVPVDQVENRWTGAVVSARTLLRSLPAKLAPRVAGMNAEQTQELLQQEIDDALTVLARGSGRGSGAEPTGANRPGPRRARGEGRSKVGSAPKADRKPVGRRPPRTRKTKS